jgi:hypothetical protein
MSVRYYTATLVRDPGRNFFSIKFRHPRRYTADGKPGLNVRRGLGTDDEAEARFMVEQMNEILADESLWVPMAREAAARRFHPRIVGGFYDGLAASVVDPAQERDRFLPLPGRDQGYRRILLVGTFGTGKTTLLRQVLGTDPETERFPATSANRTTTAKLEAILTDGPYYQAVATFVPRDEVRQYIEESIAEAALVHLGDGSSDEVARRLLEHRDQRFRLSHLLGTLPTKTSKFVKAFDSGTEKASPKGAFFDEPELLTEADRNAMRETLRGYINRIQGMTDAWRLRAFPTKAWDDVEEAKQRCEEQLPDEADFVALVDEILAEITRRCSDRQDGQMEFDKDGWPTLWQFSSSCRGEFMRIVGRFTGNHERHFGRLLTPLVEGIRVAGPFRPRWRANEAIPRLVFIDGEGLGHRVETIASVPTSVARRFKDADVILLVDTARQPMQPAPFTAVKTIVSAGYESKLMICFTHFDLVEGDNLPDDQAKMNHVLYALTNLLDKVGQDIDRVAEEALEKVLQDRVFFAAHLNRMDIPGDASLTITHLNHLINAIEAVTEPDRSDVRLYYEEHKLPLGVRAALKGFHQTWQALLGLEARPDIPKEHWARIKALSRHIGYLGKDEYFHLKPAADLVDRLIQQIGRYLDRPHRIIPDQADEDVRLAAIARVKNRVHSELLDLVRDLLIVKRSTDWQAAFGLSGTGSTVKRAQAIRGIYEAAAPLAEDFDSLEAEDIFCVIQGLVADAIRDVGGRLVQDPEVSLRSALRA